MGHVCEHRTGQMLNRLIPRHEAFLLLAVFLLAALMRVKAGWPALTGEQGFVAGDDDDYYRIAISFLDTGKLLDTEYGTVAYRMPFFPMVLAANYALLGREPYTAEPFLILLSSLTCIGVYVWGRDMLGPAFGLAGALLTSIDVQLVQYSQFLLTETLMVFLTLCCLIAFERLGRNLSWPHAVMVGLLAGLATLTRVNFLVFVPLALLWLVGSAGHNRRRAIKCALIVGLIVGSIWSAWIVRNYVELHAFVPLTTQSGSGYWGVYNDLAADPARKLEFGGWIWLIPDLSAPSDEPAEIYADRLQRDLALQWMRAHPLRATAVALMQAVQLWRPETALDYFLLPFLYAAASIGLVRVFRVNRNGIMPWIILALAFTAMAIPTIAVPRFHLPLNTGIDLLAAYAFVTSAQRISLKRREEPLHHMSLGESVVREINFLE